MPGKGRLSDSRWRWVSLAALVPLGALLASTLTTSPASALSFKQIEPGYTGVIYGYDTRCLDDAGRLLAEYNPVLLWNCNRQANQNWDYTSTVIFVQGTTACLTAGGYTQGSPVFIYPCGDGGQAQVWEAQPGGALYNPLTNMCLDDPAYSTSGVQLDMWSCNGGANQIWLGQG